MSTFLPNSTPNTFSGPIINSILPNFPMFSSFTTIPFVLFILSFDPEIFSKSCIIFKHGAIYVKFFKKMFVSSTYWHNFISRSTPPLMIFIPFISLLFLTIHDRGSAWIINNNADIASPCLMPLDNGKYSEIVPFVMRALFAYLYIVLIQPMNRSPKLNFFNTLKSHDHSTQSKAFSWSRRSIMESSDFELMISSNSRIFSPIYLPFMHPLWSVWIISGSTVFILSAKALDRILKSVFRSEIGLAVSNVSSASFFVKQFNDS